MKTLLLLLVTIVAMVSCEYKGKESQLTPYEDKMYEKVVVLDGLENPAIDDITLKRTYKVNRISKGVVAYATVKGIYETNDTLLVKTSIFE